MEGLVALAGLIVCTTTLFGIGAFVATLTSGRVKAKTTLGRVTLWLTAFASTVFTVWIIPNYGEIRDQQELNRASGDCGWHEFKRVKGVKGVYFEASSDGPSDAGVATLIEIYPVVEYRRGDGKVGRATKTIPASEKSIQEVGRTYRYGVRKSRERVSEVVDRAKYTVYDFDANEVLAENVEYSFRESRLNSWATMFFAFVAFQRSDCGGMYGDTWRDRLRSVLSPAWELEPAQYQAIEREVATEVLLEVVKSEHFNPDRVMSSEEWGDATYDRSRSSRCQQLIRPEFDGSGFFNFVRDSTLQRKAPTRVGIQICDPEQIWLGYYAAGSDASKVVIAKYALDGRLIYRLKFQKPDVSAGYVGTIAGPTFRSESGYLVFDWVTANPSGTRWNVNRRINVRIAEPQ